MLSVRTLHRFESPHGDFEELPREIINDDDSAGGKLLWLALGGQLPPFFVCFVMAPWKVFLQLGPFDEQLDRLRVQVELPDVLCLGMIMEF